MKIREYLSCILIAVLLVSCNKEPQKVSVTGITVNPSSLSMVEGDSQNIVATISPSNADNKTVIWSSSDGTVASVNNGTVSALKAGSATITAKSDDGGYTATCSVTVSPLIIDVTSISLSKTELSLYEGELETITATVIPSNATDKNVTWSSSDPTIATVDGGKITAIKEGTTTITAKVGEKRAECKVTVEHDTMNDAISFADSNVKEALVAAFDTNGDGELSYAEAAKVTSIDDVFGSSKQYKSFDEFQYFTGVTSIKDNMFEYWTISSIIIPDSVSSIGWQAFKDCEKLSFVRLPNAINKLRLELFRGCANLSSVSIPESVTEIESGIFFGCKNLISVNIPQSVTEIPHSCFYGCSSLISLSIPNSVTKIGSYAFNGCDNLVSINLPNAVSTIERNAFSSCSSLTSFTIPESVTVIQTYCFHNCTNLATVTIPANVVKIQDYAFLNCKKLVSITILAGQVPSGGNGMFNETNNCPIFVPVKSLDTYKTAEYWKEYSDRIQAISTN